MPQETSMTVDGQALHYVADGDGRPAIVFIHGFSCSHTDWAPQMAHFAPRHRVIAIDQRGHGRSTGFSDGFAIETYGADVCTLIEELDIGPAVLVGHSLGCRVVMEAASERPDLVAGTIFVDGSRSAEGDREAAEYYARDLMEEKGGMDNMRRGLFEAMFLPGADPALSQPILERALAIPLPVAESLWVSMLGYDGGVMESALSGIECPALVLQSTDRAPDYAGRRSLEEGDSTTWTQLADRVISEVEVEIIPGVGHFTMLEAPEATNASIERFIAKLG